MLGGPPTVSCRSWGSGLGLDGRNPRPASAYQNHPRSQTDAESVPAAVGRSVEAAGSAMFFVCYDSVPASEITMVDSLRMATVLITGTSGFIGRALAARLHPRHEVLCLSRKATPVDGVTAFTGDFANPDDLARLDGSDVDVLVHLAAVTGGCSEEDGIRVNVQGTHGLLRYLVEHGCRKFVLASSIAVVGMQSIHFRPQQLPIPDEHPCLDRDGYGLSKYLMEEVTRYLGRQNPELDIINIRLAAIMPDDARPELFSVADPLREWAFGALARMYLSDAIECFSLAVERPHRPGVQVMNAVAATACTADPVPDLLKAWYGSDADRIDMSHYQRPGHERDAVYSIQRVADELGFVPRRTTI